MPARSKAFLVVQTDPNSTAAAISLLHELGEAFRAPFLAEAADRLGGRLTGGAVRAAVLVALDDETASERAARVTEELVRDHDALVVAGVDPRKAPGIVARRRSNCPTEQANIMRRIRANRAKRKTERLRLEP